MKKIKIAYTLIGLLLAFTSSTANTSFPKYEASDFSNFLEYFEFLIPFFEKSMDPSKDEDAYQRFGYSAYGELRPYLSHQSRKVRWHALAHLWNFIRFETDTERCQLMLAEMISCFENRDGSNDQWMAKRIIIFPPSYYNDDGKDELLRLMSEDSWNGHTLKYLILAVGIANPPGSIDLLKERFSKQGWYSSLALARLGCEESLNRILKDFSPENKVDIENENLSFIHRALRPDIQSYMMGLGYTHQEKAIEKLVEYAFRDDTNLESNDVRPSNFATSAVRVLAMIFNGFPLEDINIWSTIHEDRVEMARKWLKSNYSKNSISQLLHGNEVHGWR